MRITFVFVLLFMSGKVFAQSFTERITNQVNLLRQKNFSEINSQISFVKMQSSFDFFKTYPSIGEGILTKKDFVISYNEKFDDPNFKISDSALRGVLAHELAHIADFQQKSYFHLLEIGFYYLFFSQGESVKAYERKIDMLVLCKGLGSDLLDFRNWLYGQLNEKDVELKKQIYLTPEDIRTFDQKHCDQLKAL
jgi:hypothetical protein